MAKKLKLNLDELKVKSFVTSLDEAQQKDVKGGIGDDPDTQTWASACRFCQTATCLCKSNECGPGTWEM